LVHGLEKFREYFRNHTDQYVFIGGTACDILMDELGSTFRATKDLDIVLIIETLDSSFGETFWRFIKDGGYEHCEKETNNNQFYRFTHPKVSAFPKMIELFSKAPHHFERNPKHHLSPIHIDKTIISLSAILINDEYYELLVKGKRTIDGFSLIDIETVILFKIKAWLDLKAQNDTREDIDIRNIKKHKNDIFRLLSNISSSKRVKVSESVLKDVLMFIDKINEDKPDLKNLGIGSYNFEEMIQILTKLCVK